MKRKVVKTLRQESKKLVKSGRILL